MDSISILSVAVIDFVLLLCVFKEMELNIWKTLLFQMEKIHWMLMKMGWKCPLFLMVSILIQSASVHQIPIKVIWINVKRLIDQLFGWLIDQCLMPIWQCTDRPIIWLIDWSVFNAVLAVFKPFNGYLICVLHCIDVDNNKKGTVYYKKKSNVYTSRHVNW